MNLNQQILYLYQKTSTQISPEAEKLLVAAHKKEKNKRAKQVLGLILENLKVAKKEKRATCQDTGTPIFYVDYNPRKENPEKLTKIINQATKLATQKLPLRPNAVNSQTGQNIGNVPLIYFTPAKKLQISLMLKGGGSENIFQLYKLPNSELKADRNEAGVLKCILDAVKRAGAKGCPPYFITVAIGGNVAEVSEATQRLHLETGSPSTSPSRQARGLRSRPSEKWLREINKLKIGALGFGGGATALSLKIKYLNRHPASFFVAVNFCCWSKRVATLN